MPITCSTYQLIFYAWVSMAILIFFLLLKVNAPYGRHTVSGWGPMVDNRVGWFWMEFPAFAVMFYFLIRSFPVQNPLLFIMMGLFCFHYINRSFIFPFRLQTPGKKMPLFIMFSGIFFNLINTGLLGFYFIHFAKYEMSWLWDWRFICGILLFVCGLWINWKADAILISLRKPGETGYSIPGGWLFRYISCPNMLGEMIEWAGFALLCWNMPALAFFTWTVANLLPRALAHHRWYKNKFSDYPASRKAVIPYVC
jgi:3-oxo-5-alpha-steroid 4-dehydrogenase 1